MLYNLYQQTNVFWHSWSCVKMIFWLSLLFSNDYCHEQHHNMIKSEWVYQSGSIAFQRLHQLHQLQVRLETEEISLTDHYRATHGYSSETEGEEIKINQVL